MCYTENDLHERTHFIIFITSDNKSMTIADFHIASIFLSNKINERLIHTTLIHIKIISHNAVITHCKNTIVKETNLLFSTVVMMQIII